MKVRSNEDYEVVGIELQGGTDGMRFTVEVKPLKGVYVDKDLTPSLPEPEGDYYNDLADGFYITEEGYISYDVMQDFDMEE